MPHPSSSLPGHLESGHLEYCAALLHRYDNDRFLACLMAPAERRPALFAIHAFNLEIARIQEMVKEPILGRIRLQWWRDAIGNLAAEGQAPPAGPDTPAGAGAGNDLLQALAAAWSRWRPDHRHFERLIEARGADLAGRPPERLVDLLAYAEATAAPLIWLSLEVLAHPGPGPGPGPDPGPAGALAPSAPGLVPVPMPVPVPPAAIEAGRRVGIAYALTGLLRAVPFHAARQVVRLPVELLARHGLTVSTVLTPGPGRPAALKPVVEALAAVARQELAAARALRAGVPVHLRPALLPATLADHYLTRIAACRFDVFALAARPPAPWRPLGLAWQAWRRRY